MKPFLIDENALIRDIVAQDYRTADIFRKHDIEYCCGGKWPLDIACKMKGLETSVIVNELEQCVRQVAIPNTLDFNSWSIDFLVDYIIHVHHHYLYSAIPQLSDHVARFADGHRKKFDYLAEMEEQVKKLAAYLVPHMLHEEEIIFPYIKQISHAYQSRESYGSLLVRTLRKPVEELMSHEHDTITGALRRLRQITADYSPPANACISHRVTFLKLKEVDNDLAQHLHLENNILFSKAIMMEKALLQQYGPDNASA